MLKNEYTHVIFLLYCTEKYVSHDDEPIFFLSTIDYIIGQYYWFHLITFLLCQPDIFSTATSTHQQSEKWAVTSDILIQYNCLK